MKRFRFNTMLLARLGEVGQVSVTKEAIEAVLTGEIRTHSHAGAGTLDADLTAIAELIGSGILRRIGGTWSFDGNSYALENHDHDGVYAEAEHDHGSTYAVFAHNHTGVYAPVGAYEPALESPIADGYVLSSSSAGVRSWISPGGGGGLTQAQILTRQL